MNFGYIVQKVRNQKLEKIHISVTNDTNVSRKLLVVTSNGQLVLNNTSFTNNKANLKKCIESILNQSYKI